MQAPRGSCKKSTCINIGRMATLRKKTTTNCCLLPSPTSWHPSSQRTRRKHGAGWALFAASGIIFKVVLIISAINISFSWLSSLLAAAVLRASLILDLLGWDGIWHFITLPRHCQSLLVFFVSTADGALKKEWRRHWMSQREVIQQKKGLKWCRDCSVVAIRRFLSFRVEHPERSSSK